MTVEDRAWDTQDAVGALSDADLLAAIRQADRGALHELFTRHEPWLSTRLARRCSDPTIVDTAIQETFLAVWRKPNGWRGEGEIAAWLWGIAVRSMLNQLRPRANVVPGRIVLEKLAVTVQKYPTEQARPEHEVWRPSGLTSSTSFPANHPGGQASTGNTRTGLSSTS